MVDRNKTLLYILLHHLEGWLVSRAYKTLFHVFVIGLFVSVGFRRIKR
jgi:hypothetical protein